MRLMKMCFRRYFLGEINLSKFNKISIIVLLDCHIFLPLISLMFL